MVSILLKATQESLNLCLNVILFNRIKLHKPIKSYYLREMPIHNYEFGPYTQYCRYAFALAMCPSLFSKLRQYQSPQQIVYGMLILLDMLGTIDLFQQNELLVSIFTIVHFVKIMDACIRLVEIYRSWLSQPRPLKIVREEILKPMPIQVDSPKKTMMSLIQDQEKTTDASQPTSLDDSQKDLECSKKNTKLYRNKYPIYELKIKADRQYEVTIRDLDHFDQAFEEIDIDKQRLLQIKIHFSNLILNSLKKHAHKSDKDILNKYVRQIASYQSELLLMDC